MKKNIIFLSMAVFFPATILAQKPALDLNAVENWRTSIVVAELSTNFNIGLSGDGRFLAYNERVNKENMVVMEATDGDWKRVIEKASCKAISNSDQVIVEYSDHSVGIEDLGSKEEVRLTGLDGYFLSSPQNPRWIAYRLKDSKETKLRDLSTGQGKTFPYATDLVFSSAENVLLLQAHSGDTYQVLWVNLLDGASTEIHQSVTQASALTLDSEGTRAAFLDKGDAKNGLWFYTAGGSTASLVLEEGSKTENLPIQKQIRFAKEGDGLFVTIGTPQNSSPKQKPDPTDAQLDVFSYGDNFIGEPGWVSTGSELVKVDPVNCASLALTRGYEREWDSPRGDVPKYIVVEKGIGTGGEGMWRKQASSSNLLVSTFDGSRKYLGDFNDTMGSIGAEMPRISPTGKYVVYFDRFKRNYFIRDTEKGATRNATEGIRFPLYNEDDDHAAAKPTVSMFVSWSPEDRAFYIFDGYDLWSVDPEGVRPPVNVTRGFGRRNHIVFNFDRFTNDDPILHPEKGNTALLCALNIDNKDNGFYRVSLDGSHEPEELTMGPFMYCAADRGLHMDGHTYLYTPIHSGDYYIVARMSASESPNFFLTKDFKSFKQITDSNPEKGYNWLTSELIQWKSLDGAPLQGILYKPQNFDLHKKYPVIFFYYETFSDALNVFPHPGLSGDRLNIPYFVSNGYVVCVPDIRYKIGYAGESAYKSVASAAKYLSSLPWVDANHFGLQGHSFGGFETNYIVTRSKTQFAAACSVSGLADWLTDFGDPSYRDKALDQFGQGRLGATPWEDPAAYVRNSPVFFLNKVQTPMLIVVGKKDTNVAPSQGMEMFTDLRRLDKPAWFLSYDRGDHSIEGLPDLRDFNARLKQFFDYFLKGAPRPDWMRGEAP